MVALEHAAPLALRRPLPLVVGVQHRVRLHPDAQTALVSAQLAAGPISRPALLQAGAGKFPLRNGS